MAKNKKRRNKRSKSNLLPLIAVAAGVYLLMKNRGVVAPVKPPIPDSVPGNIPVIGIRPDRRRYINTYI